MGMGQSAGCNHGPLTLDGSMLDHIDECPAQGSGRGVGASQKQVDHYLDQVFFIECGDRVVHGLVGGG